MLDTRAIADLHQGTDCRPTHVPAYQERYKAVPRGVQRTGYLMPDSSASVFLVTATKVESKARSESSVGGAAGM
jgi:hypothetical protein